MRTAVIILSLLLALPFGAGGVGLLAGAQPFAGTMDRLRVSRPLRRLIGFSEVAAAGGLLGGLGIRTRARSRRGPPRPGARRRASARPGGDRLDFGRRVPRPGLSPTLTSAVSASDDGERLAAGAADGIPRAAVLTKTPWASSRRSGA